jgi:hypothetical protein
MLLSRSMARVKSESTGDTTLGTLGHSALSVTELPEGYTAFVSYWIGKRMTTYYIWLRNYYVFGSRGPVFERCNHNIAGDQQSALSIRTTPNSRVPLWEAAERQPSAK